MGWHSANWFADRTNGPVLDPGTSSEKFEYSPDFNCSEAAMAEQARDAVVALERKVVRLEEQLAQLPMPELCSEVQRIHVTVRSGVHQCCHVRLLHSRKDDS